MTNAETAAVRDRMSLLHEISVALNADLDLDSILTTAVAFADRLGIGFCELHLLADTGEVYFKGSQPERNNLTGIELQNLVRKTLAEGVAAWVLQTGQAALILDTKSDVRCLPSLPFFLPGKGSNGHSASIGSLICAPIVVGTNQLQGVIVLVHAQPNQFDEQDLTLLQAFAMQIAIALKNTTLLSDLQNSLHETHLILDIGRRLSGALNLNDVYTALTQSIMATGADRCTLHICDELDPNNIPTRSEIVAVADVDPTNRDNSIGYRFTIAQYPVLHDLVLNQETLIINNTISDDRLLDGERDFLQKFGAHSLIVNPLITRSYVIGLISIEYRTKHNFSERELALYRTLCNQTTLALEHARQVQRTEAALSETQTLYRAGRVLAGAADLQEILQEALIEYVYSLGLDQGGVTLVTPDKQYGQLMAYVQDGQLQNVERLKFPLDEHTPYQEALLSGRPFVSIDAPNDPNLTGFHSFNQKGMPKSLLEAPMIIRGETIGWIGADSVREYRNFTQQEIDLARAMADQIAITIQNRRLLEQTERRANRLKAVARVGESVSRMLDLEEIFNSTVDLIRDRFGFYHVSIFLLDEAREWAVVHASTGEVGKIMVSTPHKLKVGSSSIVGFATANAQSRIALDVGEDKVHFQNPLLPDTRSEMALPLLSRGIVIGALDVQSTEVNAFSDEDIDTLQIMADQLANAIENARLLQNAQESRLFMKSIIDQIPDPIFIKDREHKWVVVNRAFSEGILGFVEEKVLGRTDYDYLPKKEADWFWEQDAKLFETSQAQEVEETITDADGNERILYTRKIPLLDDEGKPEYLIGIINDITDRKHSEEVLAKRAVELEESQNFLNSVIDNIPSMLFVKDVEELRFVHWNKAGEELHGLNREHVLGKNDHDLVPKEQADFFTAMDREVLNSGKPMDIPEEPLQTSSGIRLLHTRKIPVLGADGKPRFLLGISEDITERKLAEAALETNQRFLQDILDNIPASIYVLDTQGRFMLINRFFADLFDLDREVVIGKTDFDIFPQDTAEAYQNNDLEILRSDTTIQIEEQVERADGVHTYITIKFPLHDANGTAYALCGISTEISDRKRSEELLQETFAKTQSLYHISDVLATGGEQQATFETVLGEYLKLLNLKQGVLILNHPGNYNKIEALYADGQPVKSDHILLLEEDSVTQHLIRNPEPLLIENTQTHPLTKNVQGLQRFRASTLIIPLLIQGKVTGMIGVSSVELGHGFSQSDIEIGQAIADQLSVWLENRFLLREAQYRSERLQTAAEVSRAASSILNINDLIHTSVNLIRNQFDFYYVGLFMVDEAKEWAVLRAGTGEAGRIQLSKEHKLRIGGGSMIGWCIQNRQARIALDVGQEAVRFQNPYLPDTHSEMALPLISRDEVIGALTVQSTEQGAFSTEDITLLQTMADQLANAIENAILFAQTQKALAETENLYRVTQELLSARDDETVYHLAMEAISQSGIDSASIYVYVDNQDVNLVGQMLEQKAAWAAPGLPMSPDGTRFKASDMVIEQLIPQQGSILIEDIPNNPQLTDQLRRELLGRNINSLIVLPLSTYQARLGFLLVTYRTNNKKFGQQQIRFYNTLAQQVVIALENLRLLDATQRRVRREEIIREITSKIRNASNVEDILKTTVTELGKVLGASQGGITLGVQPTDPSAQPQLVNESKHHSVKHKTSPRQKPILAGNREGKNHGQ